jgi:hypothetical protein
MAEVVLDVKVNTGASTNALKEARQEIKNLTAAALEAEKAGDKALSDTYAKKAAEARDQVKDLQEKINALDPGAKAQAFAAFGQTVAGGLTAAISATALFGTKNEDLEATLVKVQSATALLQATQSIADGLKQASIIKTVALTTAQNLYTIAVGASTGAMKAFKIALLSTGIGAIVALLAQAVVMYQKLTDETEQATRATEAYNKALRRNSEELNDNLTSLSNRERLLLAQAKAEGKSQDEILTIQKQFINKRLDAQTIFANELRAKARDLTADEIKSLIDAEKEIENLKIEFQVLELQRIENFNNARLQKEKDYLDKLKQERAKNAEIEKLETENVDELPIVKKDAIIAQKRSDINAASYIEEIQAKQRQLQADKQLAFDSIKQVSDIINTLPAKTEAGRKRQFQANKAFNIATTLIDTYLAAQKAYNSQLSIPSPDAPIRAAVAAGVTIAAGLARVAAIRAQKYDGGSTSGGSAGAGGGGGGSISAPPTPTIPVFNPQGTIIPQGQEQGQQPIKAYVLEDDISTSQNRITDIKTKALYG